MIAHILDIISRLSTEFKLMSIVYSLIFFSAFIVYYRLKKISVLSRNLLILIMIFSVIRIFVFNNPLFFRLVSKKLNHNDIGYRQKDAMKRDRDAFLKRGPYKYLFIGSSQVDAIFKGYARTHDNIGIFHMAGMGPADFVLYQPYIIDYNTENIVLYLSDLDLCRRASLLGAKLGPMQSIEKMTQLLEIFHRHNVPGNYMEFITANYLPEYRYQYIFKGLLNKLLGSKSANLQKDFIRKTKEEKFKFAISCLQHRSSKWVDYNIELLSNFLQWCNKKKIQVIIVEGHYHPQAFNTNKSVRLGVKRKVKALAQSHGSIYLDREKLYHFIENDYKDATHVRPQPAYKFTEKTMHFIENNLKSKEIYPKYVTYSSN